MRALAITLVVAACGNDRAPPPGDLEARTQFPTIAQLYAGDHGIYRGCGPNGGVCHNGNEFPNLDSIGSIVDAIGRDCNQKRDKQDAIHDMCERTGDFVEIAGQLVEIAWIVPIEGTGEPPRQWKLGLRYAPPAFGGNERLRVERDGVTVVTLADLVIALQYDPTAPTEVTLVLQDPPAGGGFDFGAEVAKRFARAGIPGAADAFHVGDPNRNGIFGAELGAKLIKPGDPQRSYLLRRLTDPTAGPLMPRANCCYWTKPALRAMWCWVAGLNPDGGNALGQIDYNDCPPPPAVELDYPEPGEGCETAGHCPVVAIGGTGEATFASIYTEILVPKCGGEGCHDRKPFGGDVDMRDEDSAYASLAREVVPGDPDASELARRLDAAICTAPCEPMPLGRPLLPVEDIDRIRTWITDGANP